MGESVAPAGLVGRGSGLPQEARSIPRRFDSSYNQKNRHGKPCLHFLVEMGGVEPPSERISSGTSPGAESCLKFPSPSANSHAQGSGSFIVHGALKALRTHVHHLSTPRPGPWSSRAGRSPLMQREELRCRCSLIYKFARF